MLSSHIKNELLQAARLVPTMSVWKHKKGGIYQVMGHGYDTEHSRVNVHYCRIDGPDFDPETDGYIVWDRPLFMWTSPRFVRI